MANQLLPRLQDRRAGRRTMDELHALPPLPPRAPAVTARSLFWLAAGALAWTHAGYPLTAAALARLRPRPVRRDDATPEVTVVVAAHDEEGVIGRRVENLLRLDYPADRLAVVVASDGSTDGTNAVVEAAAAR